MSMSPADAKSWLMRSASGVHHRLWWLRAKTLGVRAMVIHERAVLLVRHTYLPGWYLPGGAVDSGESAEGAVVRELREETGILCAERPVLHGFYHNRAHSPRDHVACYIVRRFKSVRKGPDWEIAESRFFPVDFLPEGTTPATRARLAELLSGQSVSEDW